MAANQEPSVPFQPASLSELLARYVGGQASRMEEGGLLPEQGGEVQLYDAGPVQPIDPRLAWDEATAALWRPGAPVDLPSPSTVPDWRGLVAAQEPALDLAFCAGNFPQMVRNLSLLLEGGEVQKSKPVASASLSTWAEQCEKKSKPQALLAIGLLRLAQDFPRAERMLHSAKTNATGEWQSAVLNEEAGLAWHAGKRDEAARLWAKGDPRHLPTVFNRGMAALFLGKPADAIAPLKQAIAGLPESGSWHHLARLYLTLAEMRKE